MRAFAPQTIGTLDDLAFRVAAEGVDSDRTAVTEVVRRAERLGASTVLTDLVIDPREPQVARQRAFGELLSFLSHRGKRQETRGETKQSKAAWPAHAA